MRYLLICFMALFVGCSGAPSKNLTSVPVVAVTNYWAITGKANDSSANASTSRNIYLVLDNDSSTTNGYIKQYFVASGAFSQSIAVSNVTENTYYIYFWKDINVNGIFGQFDVYGTPQAINLNNNLSIGTFNMTIIL